MQMTGISKPIRQITDWRVEYRESGDCYVLVGKASNDSRFNPLDPYEEFKDGHNIETSMLYNVDYVGRMAETANSIYSLVGNGK
jgi:hypothetical protein